MSFCRWALWEAYSASQDLLAKFKWRRKEEYGREWVKHGWSNNGKQRRDRGGKDIGSASIGCEVPSNISAVVASMYNSVHRCGLVLQM